MGTVTVPMRFLSLWPNTWINRLIWKKGSFRLIASDVVTYVWLPPLHLSCGKAGHTGGGHAMLAKEQGGEVKGPLSLRACHFTHCSGKTPDKSNLRKDRFLLIHNSQLQSTWWGRHGSRAQDSCLHCSGSPWTTMKADAQLSSFLFIHAGTPAYEMVPPTLRVANLI